MASAVPARPKLLDQMHYKLRVLHYAWKTEKSYVAWVERFLRFHKERSGTWRHPTELGKAEIEQYLTFLAADEHVSPSPQNQAFSAILFLYQKVLEIELPTIAAGRAKRRERPPVVLSRSDVQRVLKGITLAPYALMAKFLMGLGCGSWSAVGCG